MSGAGDLLAQGARNLLQSCAGFRSGDEILIAHESAAHGWYDAALPAALAAEAVLLGMKAELLEVPPTASALSPAIAARLASARRVIFLSRLGDENRFEADGASGAVRVMCYARSLSALASRFGRIDHRAQLALKGAVDTVLSRAGRIEISCPLGTRVAGAPPKTTATPADVTMRRFPMGVPAPVSAADFSGLVALARYLTPTGNRAYQPAWLAIDDAVFAEIENGAIRRFSGPEAAVDEVERHYRHVADLFGIDWSAVHSWHAGLHAGCSDPTPASENPDRWSNTVFSNPRVLHFHSCGAYAPGEISWMVIDADVTIDGEDLWRKGVLRAEAFPETATCLRYWPELAEALAAPAREIGV